MGGSFFVIGSMEHGRDIQLLADYLKSRGMRGVLDYESSEQPGLAGAIAAATAAELMIVAGPVGLTEIESAAIGARLAVGKETYLVSREDGVLSHPCIVRRNSPEELLSYIFRT